MSAVFEYAWREDHARAGDTAVEMATKYINMDRPTIPVEQAGAMAAVSAAWAAIAQAHYAAANVRARPIRDDSPLVPEGAHIRLNGWCDQCGGLGKSGVQHVDTRTVGR